MSAHDSRKQVGWTQPTGEVEVSVYGFFTTHHEMRTSSGKLGELILYPFSSGGTFHAADGHHIDIERTSFWGSSYQVRLGDSVLGSAHPRSIFRREVEIEYDEASYVLRPQGLFSRSWTFEDAAGGGLVDIAPRGIFRRGAWLTVLRELHIDLLAFVYFAVHTRWQQESSSAAVAATSAST
jgi:hypothetical protein